MYSSSLGETGLERRGVGAWGSGPGAQSCEGKGREALGSDRGWVLRQFCSRGGRKFSVFHMGLLCGQTMCTVLSSLLRQRG